MNQTGLQRDAKVDRRLRQLSVLELVNVIWLPVAFYGLFGLELTPVNAFLTAVASLLLVQGAVYWDLKRRQLRRGAAAPDRLAWFRVLRGLNWLLIGAGWTWWVVQVVSTRSVEGAGAGLAFGLLAVAEQINYFYVQLAYDNANDLRRLVRHGLRRSHLARDLAKAG